MEAATGEAQWAPEELEQLHRAAHSRLGDRVVALAERILGEPIGARMDAVRIATNAAGFDPFGFDPKLARYALALTALAHRFYFRTEVHGIENAVHGRALYVANHSGQIPLDGMFIVTALMLDADPPILPRSMVERWTAELPFLSVFFPRMGQVLGSPDNARRLLEQDQPLMVFPEGIQGISKPFDKRYQLQGFGRGFMRLALETRAPVVPVAVIGAEEQYPSIGNVRGIAKRLGMPALPVIPQLLFGMLLPLPVRYRLHFGTPLHFEGDPDDDDHVIDGFVSQVRSSIETLIEGGLAAREHVFW